MQESENPLIIDEGAHEDADELGLFFLNDAPTNFRGPANLHRFLDELYECYDRVRAFPDSHAESIGDFRRCVFDRMPCMVLYLVYETKTVALGVAHVNADPEKIFQRLEARRQARNNEN